MLNRPEPACLVIADIAGYTTYLAGVELDHAQDILADLVGTVVGALRPTLKLAKLEGDAAFAYALTEEIDGSLLQDAVERTYFAFRRRLRDIGQASTCDCDACMRMPNLDLKLAVHHGTVIRQRIAGREELVGSDVILVHRLLKNRVEEVLGVRAYALYTEACIAAMAADPRAQGLIEHLETTDVGGEVRCWVRDLEAAWRAEQDRKRVVITEKEAFKVYRAEVPGPPALVWEYLTSPIRRPQWSAGISEVRAAVAGSRRGQGATNHCMHGADRVVEEILDWQPVDYWTVRDTMPQPGLPKIVMTDVILEQPDGTSVVEVRLAKPRPAERAAWDGFFPHLDGILHEMTEGLARAVGQAMAEHAADRTIEPEVPATGGRHLAEPVA